MDNQGEGRGDPGGLGERFLGEGGEEGRGRAVPGGDPLGRRSGPQLYDMMDDHNARSVHSTSRELGGASNVLVHW